jgi:hypothetical protein
MAAITVTKLNLLGSENRQKNNRPRIGQLGSGNFTPVPFIVNSGNTAATSTDTFTVTLNAKTCFVLVSMFSTTGTITRSSVAVQATDTVGIPLPPLAAGGAYHSELLPVSGGETLVITTGTLATAASTIVVHEFALRGVQEINVV